MTELEFACDFEDSTEVKLAVDVLPFRLIGLNGHYATTAGGGYDLQGVSSTQGAVGETIAVVTEYSYGVEMSEPIPLHSYVKPAADGSGRAAVGTVTNNCGICIGVGATKILLKIERQTH